jgi:hypothetical protein
VISSISNTGTLTLPTTTDTLVGRATTDTLSNKTLTSPIISTISNTGTLTLPTSTDTLVGRATTDSLTNKTFADDLVVTKTNVSPAYLKVQSSQSGQVRGAQFIDTGNAKTNWLIAAQNTTDNAFEINYAAAGSTSWQSTAPVVVNGSGNILISGTITSNSANGNFIRHTNTTNTSGFDVGLLGGSGSANAYVYNRSNAAIVFGTNNSESARIDSSGRLGVGLNTLAYRISAMAVSGSSNLLFLANSDYVSSSTGSGLGIATTANSGSTSTQINAFISGGASSGNLLLNAVGGKVGIGSTSAPASTLDVTGTASVSSDTTLGGKFIVTNGNAPATSTSTGTTGQIAWDSGFIYVCVATNSWKRVALTTF